MKYDDASWHTGGEFPDGSPEEFGGTHIALFLRWCFVKGWASELHLTEEPEDTRRVAEGTLRATDFFFEYCDGNLTNDDLDDAGNAFAEEYYGEHGLYLDDYSANFEHLMYVAPEEDHDFDLFSSVLEDRLRTGVLTRSQANRKPWWRFW